MGRPVRRHRKSPAPGLGRCEAPVRGARRRSLSLLRAQPGFKVMCGLLPPLAVACAQLVGALMVLVVDAGEARGQSSAVTPRKCRCSSCFGPLPPGGAALGAG